MSTDHNSSGRLKLIPSTKMPSVAKAILPSPRRPVQKDRATAIERYNLEQMCWRVFWTTTQDITELTNILNNNLAQKETALKKNKHLHPNQYLSRLVEADIVAFLEKYKRKISNVIGHREHKMMEQTIDIVERIQQTAVGVMDTMDLWKEMLMHARGKDDLKEMMLTNRMLASERRQLIEYLEKLAELTGKVKTHISVDVLQENMQIVCKIIQQADLLNETQKLGLLNQVQQSVTLTMSKSIDDQGV